MNTLKPDFSKYADALVPVIVQDEVTNVVLMLGFMNEEALIKTQETNLVTFFSRAKQRLWVKGETSNNFLHVKDVKLDCDSDTILIKALPDGPVCHTGADTCFNEQNESPNFITHLDKIILDRKTNPDESSYTNSLFTKGINAVAQKVGEEAVELIIEAKDNNDVKFLDEAADLMFHYLVLLREKGFSLADVNDVLRKRHYNKAISK